MTEVAIVRLLADAQASIPAIAGWYKSEWAGWFGDTPPEEIETDFRNAANRDRLPLALAAFDKASTLLGACSIRDDPFEPYPHASPWLRGLYVHTPFRGEGVADALIRAACDHAKRLQIPRLYAATHSAIGTFERAGWLGFDQVQHDGQALTIFATRTG
ncbi:MAG: GNAT family N-acetyltransferase [Burkholderiales bacterium]|nr:GNAT family N-acetyltransferase [Burkholderiales bacterium]